MAVAKKKPVPEKIEVYQFENNNAVESAIKQLSDLQKEKAKLSDEANAAIQAIQEELSNAVAPITKEINKLTYSLRDYCVERKHIFFSVKKTLSLATGELSFRSIQPSVDQNSTKKLVDKILTKNNMLDFVEKAEKKLAKIFLALDVKLDKKAIQKDPKKAKEVTGVGLIEGLERFYIKPTETNLEIEAPLED